MFNVHRFNTDNRFNTHCAPAQTHQWITVPNPVNKRVLLRACDNCGVVKSQNTVTTRCKAAPGQHLITSALRAVHI